MRHKVYKVKFNEEQKNIINTIESDKVRISIMSIYSYFLSKSENGALSFSYRKFLKAYNRGHKDKAISIATLKSRIELMVDLKLIERVKKGNSFIYQLNTFLNSFLNKENCPQDLENTKVDEDSQEHKYINNKIYNIDNIDSYSYTGYRKFEKDNLEKCNSLVEVRRKAVELLKDFRVKNNWIKDRVMVKVTKHYRNITVRFLDRYIIKVIESTIDLYYSNYKKYVKNSFRPNFTGRDYSKLDMHKLELRLLGWE